eukprot:scaffold3962_cov172-Skeletonema_dohrnii-CCMP3373.AAC.1
MTSNNKCADCNTNIGGGSCFFRNSKLNCAACNKTICAKCASDQALIPYTPNEEPMPIQKSSIKCY